MKVVIAGGNGSVGRRLADDCASRGDDVTILTRSPRPDIHHRQVRWDGRTVGQRALAIHCDAGQGVVDEQHPVADGPPQMSGVARPWEHAAEHAATDRLVIMRAGIVRDHGTPSFDRLVHLPKLGLGGRISTGTTRLLDAGFEFNHPNFDSAVQHLLVNGG